MALPPIAVTEVALSGISRYYNISGRTPMAIYYRPRPNQVPAYIAYRASPQNIQEAFSQC